MFSFMCLCFHSYAEHIYACICVCVCIQREGDIRQDSRGRGIISKKLGSVEKE